MVTALDLKLRPRVTSIIERFGTDAVFNARTKVYDPKTGITAYGPDDLHTVKISPPAPYDTKFVDGETIKAQDARSFVSAEDVEAAGFEIELSRKVTFDSVDWAIVNFRTHRSGDQVAAYELQLRR